MTISLIHFKMNKFFTMVVILRFFGLQSLKLISIALLEAGGGHCSNLCWEIFWKRASLLSNPVFSSCSGQCPPDLKCGVEIGFPPATR